jgi:nicotinate-nucleotide pyrophosphorylase (carboxylating)
MKECIPPFCEKLPLMKHVLILCTGNSCRSQMAEALWNQLAAGAWQAVSAGSRPAGFVHPLALRALAERGTPTTGLQSKSSDAFVGKKFDLVVTVCDEAQGGCPVFPATRSLHWPFYDPAKATGSEAEQLNVFRRVRDQIAWQINNFLAESSHGSPKARSGLDLSLEERESFERLVDAALAEDLGGGVDATSEAVVPAEVQGTAVLLARRPGVVAGLAACAEVIRRKASAIQWQPLAHDGERVFAGQTLGVISGPARDILRVERTCLNFLGRLSGIATLTDQYVSRLAGTSAQLCDTRKTTPGWRHLEKFAVRCGGGTNHRIGLYDAVLIKDNHLAVLRREGDTPETAARRAIRQARNWITNNAQLLPHGDRTWIQLEVDRLEMLPAALEEHPEMILLDNLSPAVLAKAVELRNQLAPKVILEASGGITLETIAAVAASGVDRISVGAITHSATNFDIGLDWQLEG